LDDSTTSPIFFVTFPLRNPRMLWFCQEVALAISAIVAPTFRRRSFNTLAFFVSVRLSAGDFDFLILRSAIFLGVALATFLSPFLNFIFVRDGFCFDADPSIVLGFSLEVSSVFIVSSLSRG
jgi:hypothetical protein